MTLTIRMLPEIKETLKMMALAENRKISDLIEDSVKLFIKSQSHEETIKKVREQIQNLSS